MTLVAQSRILQGMAREDVVPSVFAKIRPTRCSPYVALLFEASQAGLPEDDQLDIVDRLATITVVFLLFIYALVTVSCLNLRGKDETSDTYRANTALLIVGIIRNLAVLGYTLIDDPEALLWVAGLLAVGLCCSSPRSSACSTRRPARCSSAGRPRRASAPPAEPGDGDAGAAPRAAPASAGHAGGGGEI